MSAAFCNAALSVPVTSAFPDWATVMVRLGRLDPETETRVQEILATDKTTTTAIT
jgi:hypothetical protein